MALIDVGEILNDPDFVDALTLVYRKPTVNSFGENILEETCVQTVGCVQPASGKTLQRLPEALRVANISSFWIKGELPVSAPGDYPLQILFQNKRFNIQNVFDWTNWGGGWSEGTCIVEVPA